MIDAFAGYRTTLSIVQHNISPSFVLHTENNSFILALVQRTIRPFTRFTDFANHSVTSKHGTKYVNTFNDYFSFKYGKNMNMKCYCV